MKRLRNVAASVRQRLLNEARASGRPLTRPTKDIDLLGYMDNDIDQVGAAIAAICTREVEPDGLAFFPESVRAGRIAEGAAPQPAMAEYPTLLDLPAPRVRGYTRESVIAEKLHAMVRRGRLNSRLRDFFDVWSLSRRYPFGGETLSRAIRETFVRRDTEVPSAPIGLTREFATDPDKQRQDRQIVRMRLVAEKLAHRFETLRGEARGPGLATGGQDGGHTIGAELALASVRGLGEPVRAQQ